MTPLNTIEKFIDVPVILEIFKGGEIKVEGTIKAIETSKKPSYIFETPDASAEIRLLSRYLRENKILHGTAEINDAYKFKYAAIIKE